MNVAIVGVLLTKEEQQELRILAAQAGVSMREYARQAVIAAIQAAKQEVTE
jgi:hypothetical protein